MKNYNNRKYFANITNLEQAKKQYRKLVMQLHPDKGGPQTEFLQMQQEYQELLLSFKQTNNNSKNNNTTSDENELLKELSKFGKVFLKSEVPQNFLKQKVKNCNSPYERVLYSGIINLLDGLK